MTISPKQIEKRLIDAQKRAISDGVNEENVNPVALVLVLNEMQVGQFPERDITPLSRVQVASSSPLPPTVAEWAAPYSQLSHTDKFVVVASYLFDHDHQQKFDTEDILGIYSKVRWEKPTNPADTMARAAKKLFFAEAEEDKSDKGLKLWQLTNTGYSHYQQLAEEANHG